MAVLPLGFLTVLGLLATLGVTAPTSAYADEPQQPPKSSPFSGPIGGKRLGSTEAAVYPEKAALTPPPDVNAEAYIVADLDSGTVYAARDAHRTLAPADTLKTLTALTLLPRLDQRATYNATRADTHTPGSDAGLHPGEQYTVEQLFYGLMLTSGNDAAHALASANRGTNVTVEQMTEQARRLGAYDTIVKNPSGRDAEGQVSSAYDLALIGRAAMRNENFVRYVTTPKFEFPSAGTTAGPGKQEKDASSDQGKEADATKDTTKQATGSAGASQLQNTNELLTSYPGAIGVKEGRSPEAGHTLIGAAERGEHRLLVVLLGSGKNVEQQAGRLLDWGFDLRTEDAGTATGANASEAVPASVGRLVEPRDVTRAASGDTNGTSRSSRAIEGEPDGPTVTRPEQESGPRQETLASAALGMLNTQTVLLLGGWLVFIGLASLRVRSYVRTHHPRRPR